MENQLFLYPLWLILLKILLQNVFNIHSYFDFYLKIYWFLLNHFKNNRLDPILID